MPSDLPMVSPDDPLTAEGENAVRAAVNGLRGMGVDAGTMELVWDGETPYLRAVVPPIFQWFYTTSAITTATASATGTAIGSATMTDGSGTARRCKETGAAGSAPTRVPDTNVSDETIYNPVVYTTQIAAGSFVRCEWAGGRWEVDLVIRCPGT